MPAVFKKETLLGSEEILRLVEEKQRERQEYTHILAHRAGVELFLLERVAQVANNQVLFIFMFILKNGPVTRKELKRVFSSSSVDRYLPQLEAVEAVESRGTKYRVKRIENIV